MEEEPDIAATAPRFKREPEPTNCPDCGGLYVFDPLVEGETCGGLYRVGWLVCAGCGRTCVTRRGFVGGPFKVAKSGRSVDADGFRLRADGQGDPTALMARIARLPDLEAALRAIARDTTEPAIKAAALAALGAA